MKPTAPQRRGTAAITALATGAVTAALLAGAPYVLWQAGGIPWPSTVNSVSDLADRLGQPLTDPLALDLLTLAGWACWAAFTLSFLRESWWYATHLPYLVRDRAVHHEHLAKVSFKGSLAAVCVGTLVVALLTVWRPQAAVARQHTVAESMGTQATLSVPYHPESQAQVRLTDDDGTNTGGQEEGSSDRRYVEYTVAQGDCLWDIAHKQLGDSVKWPRIFAANRGRLQPDGRRLTDPNRLQPGWLLRIPTPTADSSSSGEASPPSKAPHPATSEPEAGAAPDARTTGPGEEHRRHQQDEHQQVDVSAAPHGSAAISVGEAGVIGITTAAGLLAALRLYRLRQRRRALSDPEVAHEGAEQPENLATVVQQATLAAREADLPHAPPGTGDLLTRRTPPPPPQAKHVVALGIRGDVEVPLEELVAARLCTWTGPGVESALRALLISILTAAERQRPLPPRVTAALPRNLAVRLLPTLPPDVRALVQAANLDGVVQAGQEHLLAHARRHNGSDPHQDHEGEHHHLPDDSPSGQPHGPGTLLLITDQASGQDAAELAALADQASSGALGVLTLDVPLSQAARWHIDHDGTATIAATSSTHSRKSPLRVFRLTEDAGQEISTLLFGAPPRQQSEAGREGTVQGSAERGGEDAAEEDGGDDGEVPADSSRTPDSGEAGQEQAEPVRSVPGEAPEQPGPAAPVRLQLLGPVTLFARGSDEPIASHLRMEAREFLALLASHPAGLLARDIADNLRLAGGADQHAKELKNLRRSVRRTLRAATGLPHAEFIHLKGEFHKLNPGFIHTDIANFRTKIKKLSTIDGSGCIIAVRDILDDYRGPFCQGIDPVWADGIRESLARQAADAAIRAARQAERSNSQQDRQTALDLLDRLISLHPDTEALYQHSIRLNQAAGRREAAHHTYQRLTRHLAELGLEPDAATRALITTRPEASPPRPRAGAAGARARPRGTRISGRGDEKPPEAPRLSRR
ncbi:BTAD domain-containing putative transcriptional regulator [Streptomyces sp. B15]|uniref:BTAD domain-containing putative transcriptional regulator n=1 Tax=Streptomyces sp. B15 TaxID=1537797 RepID=UPI001B37A67D|nr:BTAD domain-containing putative transcriptional regulator [Streptomyces sp. B15]MBQ1121869.1 LysM peptidoglycan-binding domain-containing protein [Streptomyces sp. B15]